LRVPGRRLGAYRFVVAAARRYRASVRPASVTRVDLGGRVGDDLRVRPAFLVVSTRWLEVG